MYYLQPSSQWFPQSNAKANGVRSLIDKDMIFTSKWNPRRVFETIYSTESYSLNNVNVVLRSSNDPTNCPNAAPRSTHDLCQTTTNALRIDTRSHVEPRMLWYHLLRARQQPARNLIDATEKYPKIKNKETREKANTIFNEVRQFAYVLGTKGREILLIQQPIQFVSCI